MFQARLDLAAAIGKTAAAALIAAFATTAATDAQPPPLDPAPAIEAVQQLSFLVGNWSGDGWIQMGPGAREEFTQTETVEAKLDGAAILIEGIGHSKEATPRKVHHALALLSFDPSSKKLVFTSFVAGRPKLDAAAEASPGKLIWSFSPPNGGHIRYTAHIADGEWHEVGEFSRDGQQWGQFFEMHLKRN